MSKETVEKFLIVAACSETRALEVIIDVKKRGYSEDFTVLIANVDSEQSPLKQHAEVIVCEGGGVELSDFEKLQSTKFSKSLLIINHVIRPNYKTLVKATVSLAEESFLYTFNGGFQNLDLRDSFDNVQKLKTTDAGRDISDSKLSLFFRPSDQTMKRFEKERIEQGRQVVKVDSILEFENWLPQASEVFFNWCITDYVALKQAFDLSLSYPVKRTGYITVDLVDLAEDNRLKEELLNLNQSMISMLDFVNVMSTRQFFIERYEIDRSNVDLVRTEAGDTLKKLNSHSKSNEVIKLFYHGMMYYWHELDQFMEVFLKLRKFCKVELKICGRVHESVCFQGEELFPQKAEKMKQALKKYQDFPEVDYLGFTSVQNLNKAMSEADYFIGLTAANDLMAQSEFRTGVVEVLEKSDLRLLHKRTAALDALALVPGLDYLNVDNQKAEEAARLIFEDWQINKGLVNA